MDPLSVMASVAGLLTAAHEVQKLLSPYISASRETPLIATHVRDETSSTRTVLIGLQALIDASTNSAPPGGALVGIEQLVAILSGGVLLFAELEGAVRGLVALPSSPVSGRETMTSSLGAAFGSQSARYRLPLRARAQWAHREATLKPLLAQLQGFKVSVTVVLTLLQCDTDRRTEQLQTQLAANVSALLDSNRELSRRMMQLEDTLDVQTIRSRARRSIDSTATITKLTKDHSGQITDAASVAAETGETPTPAIVTNNIDSPTTTTIPPAQPLTEAIHRPPDTPSLSRWEFESDLEVSRVYRRVKRHSLDNFSFRSSIARTGAWSMLSEFSLADVSVLSVIALPLDLEYITNKQHYIDAGTKQLMPIAEEVVLDPTPEITLLGSPLIHKCFELCLLLIQIPGFKELFERERRELLPGEGTCEMMLDSQDWFGPRLDIFETMKRVVMTDEAYKLFAWNFGPLDNGNFFKNTIDIPMSGSATTATVAPFRRLTALFGQKPSCDSVDLNQDNFAFLYVITSLDGALKKLVASGVIDHRDRSSLVLDASTSSRLPKSHYKEILTRFAEAQRSSVQDLFRLMNTFETRVASSRVLWQLAGLSQTLISSLLLSNHIDSEVELLFALERMLLTPPFEISWADTIRKWSAEAKTHCASLVMEERRTRQFRAGVQDVPGARTLDDLGNKSWPRQGLLGEYIDLLSKAPQEFLRAAQFLKHLLSMALSSVAHPSPVSLAQTKDLTEALNIVERTLDEFSDRIKQSEMDVALEGLVTRVDDWKGHQVENFGKLVQFGVLSVLRGEGKDEPVHDYHAFLFERILLFLKEPRPPLRRTRGIFRLARPANATVTNQPPKLLLRGRIFITNVKDVVPTSKDGSYVLNIWWQSDPSYEKFQIRFRQEARMREWTESLNRLIASQEPPMSFTWLQTQLDQLENPYDNHDSDEEEMQTQPDELKNPPTDHDGDEEESLSDLEAIIPDVGRLAVTSGQRESIPLATLPSREVTRPFHLPLSLQGPRSASGPVSPSVRSPSPGSLSSLVPAPLRLSPSPSRAPDETWI